MKGLTIMKYTTLRRLVLVCLSLVAFSQVTYAMRQADSRRYSRSLQPVENLAEGQDTINQDFRKTLAALKKDTFAEQMPRLRCPKY